MTDYLQQIIGGCQQGDRKAQRQLYEQYKGMAYGVCLRYADDPHDAQDLLQEGFIRVFRDIGQFQGAGAFEGWVRRVFVNVALYHLKKKRSFPIATNLEEELNDLQDDTRWSVFDNDDLSAGLIQLMQQLPVGFRTVLNLFVLEGYSHAEIADQLGISIGASKSQLSRAKVLLRSMLEKNLGADSVYLTKTGAYGK
jgi:RNA polymerase sigma-70 factor (ECF subfamily)